MEVPFVLVVERPSGQKLRAPQPRRGIATSRLAPEDLKSFLDVEQLSLRCTCLAVSMSIPLNRTTVTNYLECNRAQVDDLYHDFGLTGSSEDAVLDAKLQQLVTHLLVLYLCQPFPTRDVQQPHALPERVIMLLANLTGCNIAVSF